MFTVSRQTIRKRLQTKLNDVLWDGMRRLSNRWLPVPTIRHPYPLRPMGVVT